ncbi:MAG TPA: esterase-like activity of phytase family protein, partial [Candidatus Caenarcaniphilales bacterium]
NQGQVYAQDTVDPEGIALSPRHSVFISSEGVTGQKVPPFLAEFDLKTGMQRRSFSIPARYLSNEAQQPQGIADNLGFESLALNPEGDRLFTATESALIQDFDDTAPQQPVRNRLLHYWVGEPKPFLVAEHFYPLDSASAGAVARGLVELISIDSGGHFLSLERSYSPLGGYQAQIFQVATGGATDTTAIAHLKGPLEGVEPVKKQLVLDLGHLGITLENLEGMAVGPHLKDGTQSLLLVSDNDFKAEQPSQFLLFRLKPAK